MEPRRAFRSRLFLAAGLTSLGLVPAPAPAQTQITLVPISSDVPTPVGIDHYEPANEVIMSVNYPTGLPHNFELVAQDGSRTPFSSISGLTEEIKIGTVRSGPCQGGFSVGEMFTGNGKPGQIARISAGGGAIQNPWVTLPGESGLMRGAFFQDRYCAFGGDLIVATADDTVPPPHAGSLWRVTSAGVATRLFSGPHLEGVTTVPNDAGSYGPWAGKILVGSEDLGCVYAVDAAGNATCYKLIHPDTPLRPEDIDIVLPNENFYGVDFVQGKVYGAEAAQFSGMVGDFVIAEEASGILYHVKWKGTGGTAADFLAEQVAKVTWFEHVTFSPAGINPIPPGQTPCPGGPSISVSITRPVSGHLYLNDADLGPSGTGDTIVKGDSLTAEAASSNPSNTASVRFLLDGVVQGTDGTSPYSAVIDTRVPLGFHTLTVEAQQADAPCVARASMPIRVTGYGLQASAKGVFSATNVPVEPQLHAGGAAAGKPDGSETIRILDQSVPFYATAHAVTDQAATSTASDGSLHAESESLITDVSLYGGYLKADLLRARARADHSRASGTTTASSAGSEIVGLEIGGVRYSYAAPNYTILLPGIGRLVLQETIETGTGFRKEITVNMIHLFVDTPWHKAEVIVSSAYAGVNFEEDFLAGREAELIFRADDAGADADAGSSAGTAVPISPGLYSGRLSPSDNADVYSFQTRQGERIVAVLRPSERVVVTQDPIPPGPPPPAAAISYLLDAAASTSVSGPHLPDFDLYLFDPTGAPRDASTNTNFLASVPERVELNADLPYAPPGARGTWTLEVRRRAGSVDGFYTLELALLPEALLEQNDAGLGDAPNACASARPVPLVAGSVSFPGVIRDADPADFFSFPALGGRAITITLKPDELADGANFDLYLYAPAVPGGPASCAVPVAVSTAGAGADAQGFPDLILRYPTTIPGTYVFEVRRVNGVANYVVDVAVTP